MRYSDPWCYCCDCIREDAHIDSELHWWTLCVFWLPCDHLPPCPLSLLRPGSSLNHNTIEIRPVNNPSMASKCSGERRGLASLTLRQELEILPLNEEGMLKAEKGWRLGFLCPSAKLWMQGKSSPRELKVLLQWPWAWYESETAFLLMERKFGWSGQIEPATTLLNLKRELEQGPNSLVLWRLREMRKLHKEVWS